MQLTLRVSSILECVNNNEDTKLLKTYTQFGKCSLKHTYSLATFRTLASLPGRLPLIIMIQIQGKDTACKSNQYTQ